MNHAWLIVLAPESKLRCPEDLQTLPLLPSEAIAAALKECPFLGKDGVRCKTSVADGFELPPEGVSFIPMAEVDDPVQIVRVAEFLARSLGPVTVIDDDFEKKVEVKGGASPDPIAAGLRRFAFVCERCRGTMPPVGTICPACGWNAVSRRGPSTTPPAFAPGRPERRRLPPLHTTLFWAAVIGLIGIPSALYKGARGLLGCDPPVAVKDTDPNLAATESAIMAAHLMMTSGKPPELTPEGWIEVHGTPPLISHLVSEAMNGRRYLCDAWKNPIRCTRSRNGFTYRSFGPDGRQSGDDIVRFFPAR